MEPTEPIQTNTTENSPPPSDPERELSAGERFSRDLDRINAAITEMLKAPNTDASDLQQAWAIRATLIEEFIDSLQPTADNPDPRTRVQFDVMVDKAIIFESVGNGIQYLEDLDAAEAFALLNNLDAVSGSIGEELDEKIKELGHSSKELILKLRGIIEFSNRDYLRELLADGIDYDDLIGTIYGMILEEGGDPDEILAQLDVTE